MSGLANDFVTVELFEAEGLISVEWRGFPGSEVYRSALLELLKMADENKVQNWIVNMHKMSVIRPDDQSWTAEEFLPKLFEDAAPVRVAYIPSDDISNQISLYNIANKLKKESIRVQQAQLFRTHREALRWMREEQGVVEI